MAQEKTQASSRISPLCLRAGTCGQIAVLELKLVRACQAGGGQQSCRNWGRYAAPLGQRGSKARWVEEDECCCFLMRTVPEWGVVRRVAQQRAVERDGGRVRYVSQLWCRQRVSVIPLATESEPPRQVSVLWDWVNLVEWDLFCHFLVVWLQHFS